MDQLRRVYEIKNSTLYSSYRTNTQAEGRLPVFDGDFDSNVQSPLQYGPSLINTNQGKVEVLQRFDAPPVQKAMKVTKVHLSGIASIGKLPVEVIFNRDKTTTTTTQYGSIHMIVQIIKTSQFEKLDAFYGLNLNRSAMTYGMPDSVLGCTETYLDKFPGYNNRHSISIECDPHITLTPNDFLSVFVQFKPGQSSFPNATTVETLPEIELVLSLTYFGQ